MKFKSKRVYTVAIVIALLALVFVVCSAESCGNSSASDSKMNDAQEQLAQQANDAVGMPAITRFQVKRSLKAIYELCDQAHLVTYTYIFSPMTGKFTFVCQSMGYPIPYSTEYTNPDKLANKAHWESSVVAQMDPDGLFHSPSSEATWILRSDPVSKTVSPWYCEERAEAFEYLLDDSLVNNPELQAPYKK
ncbi:MAG: hypothetical protein NTV39_02945 [Candidatus Saccharibacteria bacterium]|nr:hypothetical protein [Candidatus Saccharibacteria bacterium]